MDLIETADHRDAKYLAAQLHTNSIVMRYKMRMDRARERLHEIYLEVTEGMSAARNKPSVNIPIPALDRSCSVPRLVSARPPQLASPQFATIYRIKPSTK